MLDLTREQQKFIDQAEEDSEDLVRKTDDVLNNLKAVSLVDLFIISFVLLMFVRERQEKGLQDIE